MTTSRRRSYLLFLLPLLAYGAWRVLVMGFSEHHVQQALQGREGAVDQALAWNPAHPKALYIKALQVKQEDPEQAMELFRQVMAANPAEGRAFIEMALLRLARGEGERADALARQAVRLLPAFVPVRMQAANYWVMRGNWEAAMENWEAALITDPSLGRKVFPVMLGMAGTAQGRSLLAGLAAEPPPWWESFFSHVATHSETLEPLQALFGMRLASEVPVSEQERRNYVARLLEEGEWAEAFLVWVNGLNEEQRKQLGGLYNGGFEMPLSNEGFGWRVTIRKKLVNIRRQSSYGIQGDKALHLIFRGGEFHFRHLHQLLFRRPGIHEFNGTYRVDRLRGRGGLKWRVYCAGDPSRLLGESKVMLGLGEWEPVSFRFTVPEEPECAAQILRLESTGRSSYDHKLAGDIWLDGLSVRWIEPLPVVQAVLPGEESAGKREGESGQENR